MKHFRKINTFQNKFKTLVEAGILFEDFDLQSKP